jgi:hypothetical protein
MANSTKFKLSAPTRINGRLFFERFELENCKREILGLPKLDRDPTAPIQLVPAGQVAEELGRHRRTIGRLIVESQRATASTEAAQRKWPP